MIFKVQEIKKEASKTFSIILEKPDNLNFYPGQYLDIELPVHDPLGKTRIFSISSSPSENFTMVTYKAGISVFKKELEKIKTGDKIQSSHPAGTVVIDDSAPLIMIAGGIGIAPHRSMIKWAFDRQLNLPITLIYSNSDSDFIFKKELDSWAKKLPNLKIHYIVTSKDGRLTEDKLSLVLKATRYKQPIHYLAGPPSMVDDFEAILLKLGIDSTNIRTDRFDGY
jgi:ferredoxin-NADP reductase